VKTTVVCSGGVGGRHYLVGHRAIFRPRISPSSFRERFGFLAFVVGVLVAIVIVAAHLWREFRLVKDFENAMANATKTPTPKSRADGPGSVVRLGTSRRPAADFER